MPFNKPSDTIYKYEYASEQILFFYDLQVTNTFNKLHQLCFGIILVVVVVGGPLASGRVFCDVEQEAHGS